MKVRKLFSHYISDKSSLPRPLKELKAFQKVKLAPGEEKSVTLTIDKKAFAGIYRAAEPGRYGTGRPLPCCKP